MKVVFFGTPQFAVPSLKSLLIHPEFETVAVVTQPDKRRGRGGKVTPSPVKAVALEAGCPVWQPTRIKKDDRVLKELEALAADAFVVIAYGQILSQEILNMPRLGCVNAHGSILPEYRGAAPIQWGLYRGEAETGVTTMLMDAGMDTGPMLMEETIPIRLTDNAWDVAAKLSELSASLLLTTLQKLQQQMIRPRAQEEAKATYAPLIQKSDYVLDWTKHAKALHDQVRGFYPNCTTEFRGKALKAIATFPLGKNYWSELPEPIKGIQDAYEKADLKQDSRPGEIIGILKNYGIVVQTGSGHLLLLEVQPAGKRKLSGWDFANGSRVEVGEKLGNA